jgi:hypothetical protein
MSEAHWQPLHLCPTDRVVEVRLLHGANHKAKCSEGRTFWMLTDGRTASTHSEDKWRPCEEQV